MRHTVARSRVSMVLYHDPHPEGLEAQLVYLAERYSLIPLGSLVHAIRSGDWSRVPPRSLVVTIDDGHAGNLRLLPILHRHHVRPTVFLRTQWIGSDGALTAEDVVAMSDDFDFGSHTRSHPTLPACSAEHAEREIADSKADVEGLTGGPCVHFAYPAGAYSEAVVELVRRAGYESAHTVDIGWNHAGSDPYRLKLLSIDPQTPTRLAADLAGMSWFTRLLLGKADLRGRRVFRRAAVEQRMGA